LLGAFRKELNAFLPPEKQYVELVMGDYFRGVIRIAKGIATLEEVAKYSSVVSLVPEDALEVMRNGKLIPDEIAINVVNAVLQQPEYKNAYGIFFDGFPRNLAQQKAMDEGIVKFNGRVLGIDLYVALDVDREVIEERIARRRAEAIRLGQEVRPDDQPEKVKTRLDEYDENTAPLVEVKRSDKKNIALQGHIPGIESDVEIRTVRQNFYRLLAEHMHRFDQTKAYLLDFVPPRLEISEALKIKIIENINRLVFNISRLTFLTARLTFLCNVLLSFFSIFFSTS